MTDRRTGELPKGIGAPAGRALAAAGCERLEDLVRWREKDLLALHGMGPKAVGILREALAERGLSFAGESRGPACREGSGREQRRPSPAGCA